MPNRIKNFLKGYIATIPNNKIFSGFLWYFILTAVLTKYLKSMTLTDMFNFNIPTIVYLAISMAIFQLKRKGVFDWVKNLFEKYIIG